MTRKRPRKGAAKGETKARDYRPSKPLEDTDREEMTSALMRHFIKPGLIPACEIIIQDMLDSDNLSSAHAIIKTAKELIQKGFPEPGPAAAAKKLRKELAEIEDDMGQEGGGGQESPDAPPEPEDMGEGSPELLSGDESLPTVPSVSGSP